MNNEPYGWVKNGEYVLYIEKPDSVFNYIPLYTPPVKEQYKFGVDWSKDGNAVTVLKICEDGVAEVVFMDYQEATHPAELTDEEINVVAILQDAEIVPVGHKIWKTGEEFNKYKRIVLATAKALRKAQEK